MARQVTATDDGIPSPFTRFRLKFTGAGDSLRATLPPSPRLIKTNTDTNNVWYRFFRRVLELSEVVDSRRAHTSVKEANNE